jgi:hypothetical protein
MQANAAHSTTAGLYPLELQLTDMQQNDSNTTATQSILALGFCKAFTPCQKQQTQKRRKKTC